MNQKEKEKEKEKDLALLKTITFGLSSLCLILSIAEHKMKEVDNVEEMPSQENYLMLNETSTMNSLEELSGLDFVVINDLLYIENTDSLEEVSALSFREEENKEIFKTDSKKYITRYNETYTVSGEAFFNNAYLKNEKAFVRAAYDIEKEKFILKGLSLKDISKENITKFIDKDALLDEKNEKKITFIDEEMTVFFPERYKKYTEDNLYLIKNIDSTYTIQYFSNTLKKSSSFFEKKNLNIIKTIAIIMASISFIIIFSLCVYRFSFSKKDVFKKNYFRTINQKIFNSKQRKRNKDLFLREEKKAKIRDKKIRNDLQDKKSEIVEEVKIKIEND